jgi:hypothetical protein
VVDYERKTRSQFGCLEIPTSVVELHELFPQVQPAQNASHDVMSNLVKLQKNLFEEERQAYISATFQNGHNLAKEEHLPEDLTRMLVPLSEVV